MIVELIKRPFSRPLLFWMAGIVIQRCFHPGYLSFLLLVPPILLLLFSVFVKKRDEYAVGRVSARGWGVSFPFLLILIAVQTTELREMSGRAGASGQSKVEVWALRARERMVAPIGSLRLPEGYKSVLSTITVGERRGMPGEVRRRFSAAGIAHILSVSGFHVAIVCSFASILFSPLKRFRGGKLVKLMFTIFVVWAFAAVSGLAPPSIRAAIMLSFYLVGQYLERSSDQYNTLFASAFCMLVYNPFYLFDVGFQLSYISVASIIYFYPRLRRMVNVFNPLLAMPWKMACMSVAAQIGTSFICFYYFGQFSTVFLFANLPVGIIATVLIPTAIVWMLLPEGFVFYGAVQWVVESLCRMMMWVVEAFSSVPGASVNVRFNFVTMLLSYFILILLCRVLHIIRRARKRKISGK